jgi:hypothetical protein
MYPPKPNNSNHRPTWNASIDEPVAGNYYPINAAAYLHDTHAQFAVVVDRSQARIFFLVCVDTAPHTRDPTTDPQNQTKHNTMIGCGLPRPRPAGDSGAAPPPRRRRPGCVPMCIDVDILCTYKHACVHHHHSNPANRTHPKSGVGEPLNETSVGIEHGTWTRLGDGVVVKVCQPLYIYMYIYIYTCVCTLAPKHPSTHI